MMSRKKLLFVLGTRPEAIKLGMLMRQAPGEFETRVCITSQHGLMLQQMLSLFEIKPDYDLSVMRPNQNLSGLTARILEGMVPVLDEFKPDMVLVQGDTTTVMAGALAAFYAGIKVGHVEAGLRSDSRSEPFPEEINRRLTTQLADFHFAPTSLAANRLLNEGVSPESVFVTGNTVVDALQYVKDRLERDGALFSAYFSGLGIDTGSPFVLITSHRRENFGEGLRNICRAVLQVAASGIAVVFPVHLNPNVQQLVKEELAGVSNIHLIEPQEYDRLLFLLMHCRFVISDSGGIQEEAPSFGKRVLVLRNRTERPEGLDAGWLTLVGTDVGRIVHEARLLMEHTTPPEGGNPYGDGNASARILSIIGDRL
jgi:UDP-N-acetylglucosamine 2-epimerase (non-hydrolysing)